MYDNDRSTQYKLKNSSNSIRAMSKLRLNFESKDWRKEFRSDLRKALTKIDGKEKFLRAQFLTDDKSFFDLENILFYNVGCACFKKLDTKGLRFTRGGADQSEFSYVHQYELTDTLDLPDTYFAEWHDVKIIRPTSDRKPLDYWYSIKTSDKVQVLQQNYAGCFGLFIEMKCPCNSDVHIVSVQKPLLDGIISAFHQAINISDEVIDFISAKLDRDDNIIRKLFSEDKSSALTKRKVVNSFRTSIKWNPEDEKCIDVRIKVSESMDDSYYISGKLFQLNE